MPSVDRRVEAQAALVRADRAVHLDAIAAVDLDVALVVDPRDAEHENALGLDQPLEDPLLQYWGWRSRAGVERLHHLADGLVELGLAGVAAMDE